MTKTILAIPSCAPGGLDAAIGGHFGHCDLYTLVTLADGRVAEVLPFSTDAHALEGCLGPVRVLAEQGASALIAEGMGMRPLMGFQQAGIAVFKNMGATRVGDAVQAFINGDLPQFMPQHSCAAHAEGSCHA